MKRTVTSTVLTLLALTLLTAGANSVLFAFPGVTGKTNKTGGAGCAGGGCHGAQTATVTISGPSSLNVGQSGSYTATLSGSTKTGVNIAASDGTLGVGTAQLTLSGGELTFTAARNSSTWTFTYTPQAAGAKKLYAAGVINGHSGTWNLAADYTVTATSSTTGVDNEQPVAFQLNQNYPNPFNPSTIISYSIPQPNRVMLEVFALDGSKVSTLVNQDQDAGIHQATFQGTGLASGVYLYRIVSGTNIATRKLMLIR
jgi:hypothetical protein